MSLGISAAGWAGIAAAGVSAYGASQNAGAAQGDTNTQNVLSLYGGMINQQNKDNIQRWLAPFTDAGLSAVAQQRDLLGLNGADAQNGIVNSVQNSPQFQALLQQGQNSILQNASATGGLRGGNTQSALAKFSPALLAATLNDRFSQLGSLATAGANAGLGLGSLSSQSGAQQAALIQGSAQTNAANTLAQTSANNQLVNSINSGLGIWAGMQGSSGANAGGITSISPSYGFGSAPGGYFAGSNGSIF